MPFATAQSSSIKSEVQACRIIEIIWPPIWSTVLSKPSRITTESMLTHWGLDTKIAPLKEEVLTCVTHYQHSLHTITIDFRHLSNTDLFPLDQRLTIHSLGREIQIRLYLGFHLSISTCVTRSPSPSNATHSKLFNSQNWHQSWHQSNQYINSRLPISRDQFQWKQECKTLFMGEETRTRRLLSSLPTVPYSTRRTTVNHQHQCPIFRKLWARIMTSNRSLCMDRAVLQELPWVNKCLLREAMEETSFRVKDSTIRLKTFKSRNHQEILSLSITPWIIHQCRVKAGQDL